MKPWLMALALSRRRQLVTQTFTGNATWTAPLMTSRIDASGKGADGTPEAQGIRDASSQGDAVQGFASGAGQSVGALSWNDFQGDIAPALNAVNAGGNGNGYVVTYQGYPNSNTYTLGLYQYSFSGAIAGTAAVYKSPGWKNSGDVLTSDYGFFLITYKQTYTIPATTGAAATAFGKTFPGGAGGPATITTANNVIVTPGATYNVVVPTGGSLTISYYQ